jgi:Bacterial Ig-like domain (group 3)
MLRHRFFAHAAAAAFAAGSLCVIGQPALAADATTTVVSSPAALVWGQSLTATVTDSANATSLPTGTVAFSENGASAFATAMLSNGIATLAPGPLDVGLHTISAAYTPTDATVFIASTSAATSVAVDRANSTTTIGVTPDPTVAGQNATFNATVTATPPGAGAPTGLVDFVNHGGPSFDSVGLDAMGRASTIAFGFAGLYTIDADYLGDSHFTASSASVAARVNRAATTTTLTIAPNPAAPGATISFSAVVGVVPPGDVGPAGSLQFTIDGAPVGGAIGLGNGAIGYRGNFTAPPGNRTYLVAVSYSGDDDTEPSSTSVTVIVAGPAPGPATAASVTPVAAAQLKAMGSTLIAALRRRGFAALTSTAQTLRAGPGVVVQSVYSPNAPRGARAAAKKSVVLASGRHRFATAGTGTLRLKLTSAGRRAVRHAKSLKVAIVTRYTPAAGKAVTVTQRLTIRAKGSKHGRAAIASSWRVVGMTVRG